MSRGKKAVDVLTKDERLACARLTADVGNAVDRRRRTEANYTKNIVARAGDIISKCKAAIDAAELEGVTIATVELDKAPSRRPLLVASHALLAAGYSVSELSGDASRYASKFAMHIDWSEAGDPVATDACEPGVC